MSTLQSASSPHRAPLLRTSRLTITEVTGKGASPRSKLRPTVEVLCRFQHLYSQVLKRSKLDLVHDQETLSPKEDWDLGLPDRPTLHLTERRDRGTQKAKRFKRHFPQTVEENESLALEQPAEAVQVTEPSAGPQNAAPNTSSARSSEGPEPHSASNTLLPPLGEARALLIGVRNCERPNFVELPGAHTDVDEWYDLLIDLGWAHDHIIVMKDHPDVAWDKQPTRDNVMCEIEELVSTAEAGDSRLLVFSGHGFQLKCPEGVVKANAEADGYDECIALSNGKSIMDDELRLMLVDRTKPKTTTLAIFDCCHSGTILDMEEHGPVPDRLLCNTAAFESPASEGLVVSVSAAADHQRARENRYGGLVTQAIIEYFYQLCSWERPNLRAMKHAAQRFLDSRKCEQNVQVHCNFPANRVNCDLVLHKLKRRVL